MGVPVCLAVGTFDGVHLGHSTLIATLAARARELHALAAVLTFRNHPRNVINPAHPTPLLTPWPAKKRLLLAAPLDVVMGIAFDEELMRTSASDFVREVLRRRCQVTHLFSGRNFRFGQGALGNSELLAAMAAAHGFEYTCVDFVHEGGASISSTRIRTLLQGGGVREAATMLGRPHRIEGMVVRGDGLGRGLGFPTANLKPDPGYLVPGDGVYAVFAHVDGHAPAPGMMNIGVRPTFGGLDRRLEVHLLGFDKDIVGCHVGVDFVERLRAEQRFAGREELVAQLRRDRQHALAALESQPPRGAP